MNDDLDALLRDDFLRPPQNLSRDVMQRIEQLPRHAHRADARGTAPVRPQASLWRRLRWLAAVTGLVGSGMLGLSQLASFVFGLWIASSAI